MEPGFAPRRRWLLGALQWGAALAAARAAPSSADAPDNAVPGEPEAGQRRTLHTSDGVQLSRIERRPEAGARAPTLVFLPGWCMPAVVWREQLAGLGARWPAVALDPRGQGLSEVAERGYDVNRRADDVHDLLQTLDAPAGVVLVAWSLGVLEALQYVQRHGSSRLRALALVDNSIGEPPAPKGGGGFVRDLRRAREATVDRFVRSLFAQPQPSDLVEQIRASALRMPLEASIALLSYPLPREHWRELVLAFDRPLAYLVTSRFREQAERLRRARPRARIEVFERAGHALFLDEAPRFNALLAQWIESGPA